MHNGPIVPMVAPHETHNRLDALQISNRNWLQLICAELEHKRRAGWR
jgi:hypothetical protein